MDNPHQIPDLTDQRTFVDGVPFEAFDRIRAMPGLYWQTAPSGTLHGGFWVLTRTSDCLAVEKDPELFTSQRGVGWPYTNLPEDHPFIDQLLHMDPPRHSSVRRVVAKAFGSRIVANFEPWVREIVNDAIDDMAASDGPFDYVQKAAVPIPSRVVARVMGIPRSDEHVIVQSAIELFAAGQLQDSEDGMAIYAAALQRLYAYVADVLIPAKRRTPADDMSTVLTQAMDAGEISTEECMSLHQLLSNAGFETTHTVIGQSMRMMLEDPKIEDAVIGGLGGAGRERAVDEFLRYVTPAMFFSRTATRETELAGQKIRKNDILSMYYIAANRDPATFAEPHKFDPRRDPAGSLVFGSGVHRCIGAPLARLELSILFEELENRHVRLELAGEPKRGWSMFVNQLTELPVAIVSGN